MAICRTPTLRTSEENAHSHNMHTSTEKITSGGDDEDEDAGDDDDDDDYYYYYYYYYYV